jgi:hypothetical protein
MPGIKNVREATTLPCWISRSCTNALFSNKKVASAQHTASTRAGPRWRASSLSLSLQTVPQALLVGELFAAGRGFSRGKIRANSKERRLSTAYNTTSKVLRLNALRPTTTVECVNKESAIYLTFFFF